MAAMRGAEWVVAACTAALLLAGLGGCPKPKPAADKSPEAEAPAPTASADADAEAPPAVTAANEIDVTRYPDETPIDHALGTTHVLASAVRTQAGAGAGTVVDTLKTQTDVDEIAERQGYVLVYFIDPKDSSRKLMGWLSKTDFTSTPAPGTTPGGPPQVLACTLPLVGIQHAGGSSCERVCLDDRGCGPGGAACTGSGELLLAGKPAGIVRFCRSGGAVVPPPGVPGTQRTLDVRQEHGTCPGGYMRCGAMCRLQCRSAADCGGTAHCLAGYCLGPGAAPCAR
jgi:hypothetical protein